MPCWAAGPALVVVRCCSRTGVDAIYLSRSTGRNRTKLSETGKPRLSRSGDDGFIEAVTMNFQSSLNQRLQRIVRTDSEGKQRRALAKCFERCSRCPTGYETRVDQPRNDVRVFQHNRLSGNVDTFRGAFLDDGPIHEAPNDPSSGACYRFSFAQLFANP